MAYVYYICCVIRHSGKLTFMRAFCLGADMVGYFVIYQQRWKVPDIYLFFFYRVARFFKIEKIEIQRFSMSGESIF